MTSNKVPESESQPSLGETQDANKSLQDSKSSHAFGSRIRGAIEFFGEHPFVTGVLALVGVLGLGFSVVGFFTDRGEAEETSEQLERVEESLAAVTSELEEQRGYIRNAAAAFLQTKMQLKNFNLSDEELWEKALGKVAGDTGIPLQDLQGGIALFVASVGQNEDASKLDKALAQFATGAYDSAGDLAFLAAEEAAQKRVAAESLIQQMAEARRSALAAERESLTLAGQSRAAAGRSFEAADAFALALEVNADLREEEPIAWGFLQGQLGLAASNCVAVSEGQEIQRWIQVSVDAHHQALEVFTRESQPKYWAQSLTNLAITLEHQSRSVSAEDRVLLLGESAAACNQALEVFTREAFPQEWASTHTALVVVLAAQADDVSGAARGRLLEEAVAANRHALEVFTREFQPRGWGLTQNNLSVVLRSQATVVSGATRARLLEESLAANRQASEVFPRDTFPQEWASTQLGFADVLREQASGESGATHGRLLEESVAAYRQALEVYTRDSFPQEWASTQKDLASVLRELARGVSGAANVRLLKEAVAANRQALEVFTREFLPQSWASAQNNLAMALGAQARAASGAVRGRLLKESVVAYQEALIVYTQDSSPLNWATIQKNLGAAFGEQADAVSGASRIRLLGKSVAAYRQALEVFKRESEPQHWARAQANLAKALASQANTESGAARDRLLEESVAASRQALEVISRDALPQDWASIQMGLASVLAGQGSAASGAARSHLLNEAEAACRQALKVFAQETQPQSWAMTQYNLGLVLWEQAHVLSGADRASLLREANAAMRVTLEVWEGKEGRREYFAAKAWIEFLEKDLQAAEMIAAAIENPQTVTDWGTAFGVGREVWKQGNHKAAEAMEMRGNELAMAAGVELQPSLGVWNGASAEELNEVAWSLVDPDRVNRETDFQLGLVLIRAAVALSPNEAPLYDTLAWALYANGQLKEAIAASKVALDKAPPASNVEYQGYLDRLNRMADQVHD